MAEVTDDEIAEFERCRAIIAWDEVWQLSDRKLPYRAYKRGEPGDGYLAVLFDGDEWRVERISFDELCPFFGGGKDDPIYPSREAAEEAARG